MITRSLMGEIETGLLQAHTKIFNNPQSVTMKESSFLQSANQNEARIKQLMLAVQERRSALEKEIQKCGYSNYTQIADNVYRFMESKLRTELIRPSGTAKFFERENFEKFARKIKSESQTIFFQTYFTK